MEEADQPFEKLKAEIHRLGMALGSVIRQIEGPAIYEVVERLRKAAQDARAGEPASDKQLESEVARLDLHEAYEVAMAFTTYFELVNIAEENFRIHRLRERRAAVRRNPQAPPMRESLDAALAELRRRGVTVGQLQSILDRLQIELVVTAHPTEPKRRTMLTKLARLARQLRHDTAPAEHRVTALDPFGLEREITSLWLTDRSRTNRPEVLDEVRSALWYFETALYDTVPLLEQELEQALARHYPGAQAPTRWLTFGSWVGGDRDGNPNVTPKTTALTLALHRRMALQMLSRRAQEASRLLSISTRRDRISAELQQLLRACGQLNAHVQALADRYPHEPYRLLLAGLRARVDEAYEEATSQPLVQSGEPPVLLQAGDVLPIIDRMVESLRTSRGSLLAGGDLRRLQRQVGTFGLHLARLDIRQHSSRHEAALHELLNPRLPEDQAYTSLDEPRRVAILSDLIGADRDTWDELRRAAGPLSQETQDVIGPLSVMGKAQLAYGAEAAGIYVISMAHALSDVLEVVALMKWTGVAMPVAPLFETLEDLDHAPGILRAMFEHEDYRQHLRSFGDHQTVMLGYSDSNKDCGYVTANWALFKAQEEIVETCRRAGVRLTLFHGRGGSIARGGGPAAKAILAQPAGLRDASIRITEQGEVLSTRYHDADLAFRILEQITYGVLLGSAAAEHGRTLPDHWRTTMEAMSQAARAAYTALVHDDPEFLHFWQTATPIEEITSLRLGSRPAFRKATKTVHDLRAIPWVFSWMQSRFNFPGWYGLGSALDAGLNLADGEMLLRSMYREWPFFQTLIDNAQLTLAKADMKIASHYASLLRHDSIRERILGILSREYRITLAGILKVTGQAQLLDHEPVLQKSVALRNPYIDPLNYIQVELLRRHRFRQANSLGDDHALRMAIELTINGISHGLKNTG
jgi:phosphoenolpyruvate carboxylase